MSRWQLDAPDTSRVVAEPDVRNTASLRAFERAGFRRTHDIELPEKRAALMVRDPETTTASPDPADSAEPGDSA